MQFPGFRFDREAHQYYLNELPIPSLSNILSESLCLFYGGGNNFEAMERGTRLHRIFELYDKNDLVESSLNEISAAYLRGWIKVRNYMRLDEFDIIEEPMPCLAHNFGCTPDRFSLKQLTLLEIKTGVETIAWPLQLSAQELAIREAFKIPVSKQIKRLSVIVEPDGYNPKNHSKPTDKNVFLNCLNVYRYKKGYL